MPPTIDVSRTWPDYPLQPDSILAVSQFDPPAPHATAAPYHPASLLIYTET